MNTMFLISGGIKSGKSALAEKLASFLGGDNVTYIATADAKDLETAERIRLHKIRRPGKWETLEAAPLEIIEKLKEYSINNPANNGQHKTFLLDCVTFWVSRLMMQETENFVIEQDARQWQLSKENILKHSGELLAAMPKDSNLIAVTGETGFSLVSPNLLGRRFQELIGQINQIFASRADNVALVSMGLPIWLKGKDPFLKE